MPDTKKILIVEDDRFLSSLMKARFEKEGFVVVQAFDGEEGQILVRKELPSLIILDLILPKISGFEVLETISVDPLLNRIPVMILTNLAQESDMQKTKHLGAIEYFVKVRISIDELVLKVKDLLARTAQAAQ